MGYGSLSFASPGGFLRQEMEERDWEEEVTLSRMEEDKVAQEFRAMQVFGHRRRSSPAPTLWGAGLFAEGELILAMRCAGALAPVHLSIGDRPLHRGDDHGVRPCDLRQRPQPRPELCQEHHRLLAFVAPLLLFLAALFLNVLLWACGWLGG